MLRRIALAQRNERIVAVPKVFAIPRSLARNNPPPTRSCVTRVADLSLQTLQTRVVDILFALAI